MVRVFVLPEFIPLLPCRSRNVPSSCKAYPAYGVCRPVDVFWQSRGGTPIAVYIQDLRVPVGTPFVPVYSGFSFLVMCEMLLPHVLGIRQGNVSTTISNLRQTCGGQAAFFARTYLPSRVSEVVGLWRKDLAKINPKAAESLADPAQYANLFPDMDLALEAEKLQVGCYSLLCSHRAFQ
jgi:hypothetical protein